MWQDKKPKKSALSRLQSGVEQAQSMRESIFVYHAIKILEQKRQCLSLIQSGLLCQAA
jgi:hypothetical protein